jgi:hypothetical protein
VRFDPLASLAANTEAKLTVEVEAIKAGQVRFRVEVKAGELTSPLRAEESTTIYAEPPPTRP